MAVMSARSRMTAALIALIALVGLTVQFEAVLGRQGSIAVTAWSVLLAHAVALAAGFLAAGFAFVWLDGRMARFKLIDLTRA